MGKSKFYVKHHATILFFAFFVFNQLNSFSQTPNVLTNTINSEKSQWMNLIQNITCDKSNGKESFVNHTGIYSLYHANKWSSKGIFFPYHPEDEIIEFRTQGSKTFSNNDGTNTAMFLSDLHYKDNSGKWQDVDLSLSANNTGLHSDFELCNTTNDYKTFIDVNSVNKGIIVEKDNYSINFMKNRIVSLQGSESKINELQRNDGIKGIVYDRRTVNFTNIYPEIDEQIVMLNKGIEHGYFINSSSVVKDISGGEVVFSEEIELPVGWKIFADGKITNKDFVANKFSLLNPDGKNGIYYNPVVIYDGSVSYDEIMKRAEIPVVGEENFAATSSFKSKYSVEIKLNKLIVKYTIPEKWLSESIRKYPIFVDPKVQIDSTLSASSQVNIGLPYNTANQDERFDFLLLVSDMTSAGISAWSTISSFGMICGTTSAGMPIGQFRIRTQPTTISTFSGWVTNGWTLNYGPATQPTPQASTWYDYTFTTNYMFDGINNMLWNLSRDTSTSSGTGSNFCRSIPIYRAAFYHGNSSYPWPYDTGPYATITLAPQMRVTYTPCTAPAPVTNVTATPSNLSCGSSSSLNATSVGNIINWYVVSTGGTRIGSSASSSDFNVTPSVTTIYYAESFSTCPSSPRISITVTVTPSIPSNPTNVTATPASVCIGATVALSGVSNQGVIQWWIAATGGNLIGSSPSGTQFSVNPTINTTYYAKTNSPCGTSTAVSITVTVTSLAVPTGLSANPASIICSGSSSLTANSSNTVTWFTSSTGGTPIGTSAGGANFIVSPTATITYYAEANQYASGSITYNYTGAVRTFSVPVGVSSVSIDLSGAQGGTTSYGTGGLGGRVQTNLSVTVGQLLYIYIGSQGSTQVSVNGWNGGGSGSNYSPNYGGSGGGASDIRIGGQALSNRLIVAGGGGGGSAYNGYSGNNGGNGGYSSGTNGLDTLAYSNGSCGGGGSQIAGGSASTYNISGYSVATSGALGTGGNACKYFGGGGGGGGYYGGGGGGPSGGGGGGSSFYSSSGLSNTVCTTGYKTGAGQLYISWSPTTCSSSTRASITVTVTGLPPATLVSATPDTLFCGGSTNLNASSPGNLIHWWNASTGGTLIGSSASGINYLIFPSVSTTYYADAYNNNPCSSTGRVSISVTIISIPQPSSVVASPTAVCVGAPSYLNGVSTGNIIKWWTASSGGTLVGTSMSGNNFYILPTVTTTYYAEAFIPGSGALTFSYTGSLQTWTVPNGVIAVSIDASGAQGGTYSSTYGTGGLGGRTRSILSVSPGQLFNIFVGGQGLTSTGGWNGGGIGGTYSGGGGGATDIRIGGTAINNRVIVAGGGGGAGYLTTGCSGGYGGDTIGGNGYYSNAYNAIYSGGGGTQTSGGPAATYTSYVATAGTLGLGGTQSSYYGGGGGGGYYGGGGGSEGGGGGGSCYVTHIGTSSTFTYHNYKSGNGQIVFSWSNVSCTSSLRTSVTVTISPVLIPTNVLATPDTFACGTNIGLSGSTIGFTISWWTSSTGGTFLGTSSNGNSLSVVPTATTNYYAESNTFVPGSITKTYTGAVQSWIVPLGVVSVTVDAIGASGGTYSTSYGAGGFGGRVQTNFAVTIGSTLYLYVGQQGASVTGGWNGGGDGGTYSGGGGGATDIRIGGYGFTNRVLVAGGGGGAGYSSANDNGGAGGDTLAANGLYSGTYSLVYCGAGGSQTGGGIAATYTGYVATAGTFGLGGTQSSYYGGGGGGGYYGGGGGSLYGGGGGGSSWVSPTLCFNTFHTQGYQSSNGQITLSWNSIACSSPGRVSVAVTVYPLPNPQNVTALPQSIACGASANLSATTGGGIIRWWDSPTGGNLLGTSLSGSFFSVLPIVNSVFYAEAYQNPCSSTLRIADSITVYSLPNPQNVTALPQNLSCGGFANLSATTVGGVIRWWDASTGGNLIGTSLSGTFYTVFPSGSTVYYAEAYQTPCSSILRVADSITVSAMSAPSSVVAVSDTVYCGGHTDISGISTGNTIRWWSSSTGGSMLGTSASGFGFTVYPSATMTYYAEAYNQCASYSRTSITIIVVPLIAPIVTVNNISICSGATGVLSGISSGNMIKWWTSSSGGTLFGTSWSGNSFNVSPTITTTYYAEAYNAGSGSHVFTYITSTIQTFTIPPGVSSINIDARGASGGYMGSGTGGRGARMTGTFSISPGNVLSILIGQCPGLTTLYPGGGGGTFVALGGSYSTATPLIVAGGGGGGYSGYNGVDAPTSQAGTFTAGGNYLGANGYGAITAPCTGGGGGFYSSGAADSLYNYPGGGGFQQGGAGACGNSANGGLSYQCGGFGGGSAGDYWSSCNTLSGNGGGYSGGSGYVTSTKYVGEAGGSYNGGTNQQNYSGASGNTGDGQVTISWTATSCTSPLRTSVIVTVSTPTNPTGVTAALSSIACGTSSNLSGNSSGFTLSWWDSLTAGNYLGTSSGGSFTVSPTTTTTYYAEEGSYGTLNTTFTFLSSSQIWTVPTGVSKVDIDARAASGYTTPSGGTGGNGGRIQASLAVSGGQIFYIYVGQQGASSSTLSGGYNGGGVGGTTIYYGGGGGGATDIRIGGTALTNRILVVGGGGGAAYTTTSYSHCNGGAGGDITGASGWYNQQYDPQYCGSGGTQSNGGAAAIYYYSGYTPATAGSLGLGGNAATYYGGGGGGGGYYGGGGGSTYGGGGGGSSWITPTGSSNVVFTPGFTLGSGRVKITWMSSICVSPARISVTVTVGLPNPPVLIATPPSICPLTSGVLTGITPVGYINWWSSATGGTLLGSSMSGNNFIINPTTLTSYYAETNSLCGISSRSFITVSVVNPTVPTNVTVSQSPISCGLSTNLSAVFSGGIIRWWTAASGGTLLGTSGSGLIFTVSPTTTKTYYAESFSTCSSASRVSIIVTVISAPPPTNASAYPSSISCGGSTDLVGISLGYTIRWWTALTGGTLLATSGTGIIYTVYPASTTTYYAESYQNPCASTIRTSITVTVNSIAAPSPISAIPSSLCGIGTSTLSAVSPGNSINWWTASTGGIMLGSTSSGGAYVVSPSNTATYYAEASAVSSGTITFNYTGSAQTWIVPAATMSLTIDAKGAQGGLYSITYGTGGLGGRVQTTLSVTPSQILNIYIGGQGATQTGGWNGGGNGGTYSGGGGGATDIRINGTGLTNRVIIAAGGGGAGYITTNCNGGSGGGLIGGSGTYSGTFNSIYCGSGGNQTVGGPAASNTSYPATAGSLGSGGAQSSLYGGGGGGGYFGGGAGSYFGGGGGGSSWIDSALTFNTIDTSGIQTGNGILLISWNSIPCLSSRTPITVMVSTSSSSAASSAIATPSVICTGDTTNLSFAGGNLASGANWYWYAGSCGGQHIGTGSLISKSPMINTTYYVRAEGGCNTTSCVSITVTINNYSQPANSLSTVQDTICAGYSTTLTLSGGILGSNGNWNWYSGTCGGLFAGLGDTVIVSPSINTDYYVRAEGFCNTTSCLSILVYIKSASVSATSATASPSAICFSSPTLLTLTGGSLSNDAQWKWYSYSCGGIYIGSGVMITQNPSVATTYYVRAEGFCNTTICVSVNVAIGIASISADSATITPSVYCNWANITINIYGGMLGTGSNWILYDGSCGGTFLSMDSVPNFFHVLPVGTNTYYIRAEGICNTTNCVSVYIQEDTVYLSPPVGFLNSNTSICPGTSINLTEQSGNQWYWYSGTCGGTFLGIDSSITLTPTATTSYFLRGECTCNTTTCLSTNIIVMQNSVSANTILANPSTICQGSSVTLSKTGGILGSNADWYWYQGSCGGTSVGNDSSIIVNATVTTLYYFRAEGSCNTTFCISTTVTVMTNSTAANSLTSNPTIICPGSSTTLTINGGTLGSSSVWNWYVSSCGGVRVATGASLNDTPTSSTIYYLRAESICNTTTCVSTNVILNSNSIAANSILASSTSICSGFATTLNLSGGTLGTGADWYWFTGSCNGTIINSGLNLIQSPLIKTTYYVKAAGICNTTNCVSVTITILSLPSAPISYSANMNNFCSDYSGNITLSISGGSGNVSKWFTGGCESTLIGTGKSLSILSPTTTTTYYANWQTANCGNSTCISELITVIPVPAGGTSATATPDTILNGQNTVLNVNGTLLPDEQWAWYENNCGTGTVVGLGDSININPQGTTTYYVRSENGVCYSGCISTELIIHGSLNNPGLLISSPNSICIGQTAVLTVSDTLNGGNWYWYLNSCGGTLIGTGDSISVNPGVSTLYCARQELGINNSSCSYSMLIVNSITIIPDSITANPMLISSGNSTILSTIGGFLGTGADWNWYTLSCGSTYTGNGNSILLSPTITTTYFVRGEGVCNTTLCESITVIVGFGISGYFTYDNPTAPSPFTPLDSVWVFLNNNGTKIDSVQADINGYYHFSGVLNGAYNISATTHKPWSGVNSTDAVKVKRHFAGSELLTSSLRLHAADVNMSFNINTTDAVKITRRFVGSDTIFTKQDWLFEKPYGGDTINVSVYKNDTVIVNGSDLQQNFRGICTGDVNGSNVPNTGAKSASKIKLNYNNVIRMKAGEYIELPVNVTNDIKAGAISLVLKYPGKLVEILNVKLKVNNEERDLYYNLISGNELRIGWFETDGFVELNKESPVIIIKLKAGINFKHGDEIAIKLENNSLSEIADEAGNPLENVVLNISKIEYNTDNKLLNTDINPANQMEIYPNPTKEILNIKYTISEDGNVKIGLYNILGEKVIDINNNYKLKGTYNSEINLSSISSGIYTCKMITGDNFIIVKKIVISK